MYIVRVIWGQDIFKREGFAKDFSICLERYTKFCTLPTIFYVYGKENAAELRSRVPLANIILLSEQPIMFKNFWFHKVNALYEAHKHMDELLYMDFDCVFVKPFHKYLAKLREKNFSVPWYKPSSACRIQFRHGRHRGRLPCNGFIYSRNKQLVSKWYESYEYFSRIYGPARRRKITDEQTLAYVCEQLHGVASLERMQNIYEPSVIQNVRQATKSDYCLVHPYERFAEFIPNINATIDLVVARYTENIEWIKYISNNIRLCIYNKNSGERLLPNVGRESHTFLYHIVSHYDKLADITIFTQGNPYAHMNEKQFFDFIYKPLHEPFMGWQERLDVFPTHITHVSLRNCPLNAHDIWKKVFGTDFEDRNYPMSFKGIFKVRKEAILKRPKSFYENCIRILEYSKDPVEGHFFERIWRVMFT